MGAYRLDKKEFRRYCLQRLKGIPKNRRYIYDKRIMKLLEQVIELYQPKSILFYLPLALEADIRQLIYKKRKKLKLFVPFIVGESFKMVKYRLPLTHNGFNIYEPSNSSLVQKRVDMIIVPVVGVDGNFKRVGFGKGMYDRFYETLSKKPVVVFVQRSKCHTDQKITDSYDIRADYYITPKKIQMLGKNNDNRDHSSRRRSLSRWSSCIF
ncbi:MAG: 5-formyltetrahydrofolate cyclo-ligase [Epsilonproteobacteria bacterium]|nr:5-formyltetrahydrofolate cyclo-ligase [Campylobacterota bacterium]